MPMEFLLQSRILSKLMKVYVPYTCTEDIYTYVTKQQIHTDKICFIIYVTIILLIYNKTHFISVYLLVCYISVKIKMQVKIRPPYQAHKPVFTPSWLSNFKTEIAVGLGVFHFMSWRLWCRLLLCRNS